VITLSGTYCIAKTVSKFDISPKLRNEIYGENVFPILILFSIKLLIFMIFDTFKIFNTICMCLVGIWTMTLIFIFK
jgi:hypothetical protein